MYGKEKNSEALLRESFHKDWGNTREHWTQEGSKDITSPVWERRVIARLEGWWVID
jgi:hypothetical protein